MDDSILDSVCLLAKGTLCGTPGSRACTAVTTGCQVVKDPVGTLLSTILG